MKKMLFVNGTYNDIPLVLAARKLGFYVITSGNDPKGEAHVYANEYIPCDYSDKEAITKLARDNQVDAICSCGNDLCAISAAYAAEQLGLPGHDTYENCRIFHEKDVFKKYTELLGLSTPKSKSFTDIEEALEHLSSVEFPQIIKPVDLGGGKGVTVVRKMEDAVDAVKDAFAASKVKHIVIEDYIEGSQHCFICYVKDEKVVFDYSSNDFSYINPYMVWVSSGFPADGYENYRDLIVSDINRLASYAHIADGIITIQYMLRDGKPFYLETMRRCLGNLHFNCISQDCGVDLYELFVATEAGLDTSEYVSKMHLDPDPNSKRSGFLGIYGSKNGIVKSITLDPEFEKKVYHHMMIEGPGHEITDYLHDKMGNVLFRFDSIAERDYFMKKKMELFKVTYTED